MNIFKLLCGIKLLLLLLVTVPALLTSAGSSHAASSPTITTTTTTTTTNISLASFELLLASFVGLLSFVVVSYIAPKKQIRSLQSCVASLSIFALAAHRHPALIFTFINPLKVLNTPLKWCCFLFLKVGALSLLDQIVLKVVKKIFNPKRLQFRVEHPGVVGLVTLEWIDYLYLSINQVIE